MADTWHRCKQMSISVETSAQISWQGDGTCFGLHMTHAALLLECPAFQLSTYPHAHMSAWETSRPDP